MKELHPINQNVLLDITEEAGEQTTASGIIPGMIKIITPFAADKVTLNGKAVAFEQQTGAVVMRTTIESQSDQKEK